MAQTSAMSDAKEDNAEWLTLRRFLLLLAAALLVVFPKVALGPTTFFYRDFGALGYPCGIFTRDSLLHGELPLWNPYSHCGVPWLAQMGQFYPLVWMAYFLPVPWSLNFLTLLHLWFGGFGMFWLLRRWQIGNFAAGFAAFAFVFNGVTFSCLLWGNYIESLAWLPWVVGCVREAWRQGGRWLAFAAVASAMQVLTATPEITLIGWGFLSAIWLGEIFSGEIKFPSSARRLGLVVLLAAGITMIQMLPFFDLLAHSQRNSGNDEATAWSMPAWGLANLIVPLFHCYESPQGTWFQPGQEFLASYYLGAGVLVIALAGVWFTRTRLAVICAGAVLFCWLLALGSHGFLYHGVRKIFPLIGVARFPVKFAILTAFLIPVLAAWSLQNLQTSPSKKPMRGVLFTGAIILLLMAVLVCLVRFFPFPSDLWNVTAWNTLERAVLLLLLLGGIYLLLKLKNHPACGGVQVMLFALLALDAATHSPKIAPTLPASVLAPGIWQNSGLPSPPKLGEGRIMISPAAEQQLSYSHVADMNLDLAGKRLAAWYNFNLLDHIPKVNGAVTLRPACFDTLEHALYDTEGGHYGMGIVDFVSAEWISSANNPTQWERQPNRLPLVTAGQKPVFEKEANLLPAVIADNFNPHEIVYLPESCRPLVTVTNRATCQILHTHFALNQVEADVNAAAPALVVFSQTYYHLWRAFIDGKPTALLRANLAFQAVQVPAGIHHIQLVYRDPYLKTGAVISAISLLACFFIWRRTPKIH